MGINLGFALALELRPRPGRYSVLSTHCQAMPGNSDPQGRTRLTLRPARNTLRFDLHPGGIAVSLSVTLHHHLEVYFFSVD